MLRFQYILKSKVKKFKVKIDWFSSCEIHSSTDLAVPSAVVAGSTKTWKLSSLTVFNGPSHDEG